MNQALYLHSAVASQIQYIMIKLSKLFLKNKLPFSIGDYHWHLLLATWKFHPGSSTDTFCLYHCILNVLSVFHNVPEFFGNNIFSLTGPKSLYFQSLHWVFNFSPSIRIIAMLLHCWETNFQYPCHSLLFLPTLFFSEIYSHALWLYCDNVLLAKTGQIYFWFLKQALISDSHFLNFNKFSLINYVWAEGFS